MNEKMDFDTQVKLAVYRHFATTATRPSAALVAEQLDVETPAVLDAFHRLRAQRMLVLEADGESIRMAPPFSGVPTQHVVKADKLRYYANCAWDALGIPATLQKPAVVYSRCEGSGEPLRLHVSREGPEASDWLFNCLVPAAHWWADVVFT
jgi:hypothetical protein